MAQPVHVLLPAHRRRPDDSLESIAASLGEEDIAIVIPWHGAITAVPIPTIERLGGGSVRCMLAEVFLPRGADPP